MVEFAPQVPVERRQRPTPRFGYYSFFGRRTEDRDSAPTFFLLVSITGLNVLDSLFTMMILDLGGWEANPVVKAVMDIHGDNFWIWKFALVSCCLTLRCLHSRYRLVKRVMVLLTSFYMVVVLYQTYLIRVQSLQPLFALLNPISILRVPEELSRHTYCPHQVLNSHSGWIPSL